MQQGRLLLRRTLIEITYDASPIYSVFCCMDCPVLAASLYPSKSRRVSAYGYAVYCLERLTIMRYWPQGKSLKLYLLIILSRSMEGRARQQTRHTSSKRQDGGSSRDVQRSGARGRYIRTESRRQHMRRRRHGRRRHERTHRQL